MSEENELSLPESAAEETADEEDHSIVNEKQNESIEIEENNFVQETPENEITDDASVPDTESPEKPNEEEEDKEINETDDSENQDDIAENGEIFDYAKNKNEIIDWLLNIEEFDKTDICEKLKGAAEEELLDILNEIQQANYYVLKENEVYEFILNEKELFQKTVGRGEIEDEMVGQESFILTYQAKCYLAKKKLEHIEKEIDLKKAGFTHELQTLNFEVESLNMSLKDLKESKDKFVKDIRIGGRHPVTKRIILQRFMKYSDDSVRNKMALTNRYKIQIQSDIMERNKILSQIKAQEKRLASLNIHEFQEAEFEHKKSCRQLAMYKEQLGKFKAKFSPLLHYIAEMKKALEKEQNEMEQMKKSVSKLEHLKEVMLTEKDRNDEKAIELKASMRKIKLDPRRHNLPEVIDYAAAKRENAKLKENIKKWQKKVERIQQEKLLYMNALRRRKL